MSRRTFGDAPAWVAGHAMVGLLWPFVVLIATLPARDGLPLWVVAVIAAGSTGVLLSLEAARRRSPDRADPVVVRYVRDALVVVTLFGLMGLGWPSVVPALVGITLLVRLLRTRRGPAS